MTREMTEDEVLSALTRADAIRTGHFVLTSGRHSDTYVQCARILEDPALTTRLAGAMAQRMTAKEVDLVISPAVGGIIIGFAVAQALGVRFMFTEREQGRMTLRRSFEIPSGARVLVVEDVVTTGGSAAEVVDVVRAAGADPVCVASIIDRGGPKEFVVDGEALLKLEVESWEPENCRLCASGEALTSPGSRRVSS